MPVWAGGFGGAGFRLERQEAHYLHFCASDEIIFPLPEKLHLAVLSSGLWVTDFFSDLIYLEIMISPSSLKTVLACTDF